MTAYYHTCPCCGANLDPGEHCVCERPGWYEVAYELDGGAVVTKLAYGTGASIMRDCGPCACVVRIEPYAPAGGPPCVACALRDGACKSACDDIQAWGWYIARQVVDQRAAVHITDPAASRHNLPQ